VEDRGHVLERVQAVGPRVTGIPGLAGGLLPGLTCNLRIIDGRGHRPLRGEPCEAGAQCIGLLNKVLATPCGMRRPASNMLIVAMQFWRVLLFAFIGLRRMSAGPGV